MEDSPPEIDDEMVRRVPIVIAVDLLMALSLIAASSLTMKVEQVNQIPLAPAPTTPSR